MSLMVTDGVATMVATDRGVWERRRSRQRGQLQGLGTQLTRVRGQIADCRLAGVDVRQLLEKEARLQEREWRLIGELELLEFGLSQSDPSVVRHASAAPRTGEPF